MEARRTGDSFALPHSDGLERLVGVHRVQRVPEGQGRRHTSTVTVALVDAGSVSGGALNPSDVIEETYRGGGPGGQHRNTSDTGVRVRHLPSGLEAKVDRGRSWWANRQAAWEELERRVVADAAASAMADMNAERVAQVGLGDRVSHDWTWCAWRDSVTCHSDGSRFNMTKALKGRF